jgi:ATP-dependent DNA ligase
MCAHMRRTAQGKVRFEEAAKLKDSIVGAVRYQLDFLVSPRVPVVLLRSETVPEGRDLTGLPLIERRVTLASLKIGIERIKVADYVEADSKDLLAVAREQGLEGIVGKRKDGRYEPGKRSGAWVKYRLNLGQEFVIGGFTPGPHGLDAITVGYYRGKDLIYLARTRNGSVPASRRRVFERLKPLITTNCPFVNLPETRKARWGEALTAEQMKKCVWVRPELVAKIEFLEWTDTDRLRHSKFAALRDDKDPRKVERVSKLGTTY